MRNVAWIRIAGVGMAVGALWLAGCGGLMKGKAQAEAAVTEYHRQFNDSKFKELYAASDSAFQKAETEKNFSEYVGAVRTKLGKVTDAKPYGFYVRTMNGRKTVELTYQTTFEKGKGTEEFVFHISGGKALLQNYRIDSKDLIVN